MNATKVAKIRRQYVLKYDTLCIELIPDKETLTFRFVTAKQATTTALYFFACFATNISAKTPFSETKRDRDVILILIILFIWWD
jgi:hypothetical protein